MKELEEKAKAFDDYIEKRNKDLTEKVTKLEGGLGEKLEDYKEIYDELSLEKKVKFLEKLGAEPTKPNFDTKPGQGADIKSDDYEKAKKGGDLMFLISNAKKI